MVTEAEARRVRPMMSGIVALAVALVAAIGWYYVGRPDESAQPVKTVEWAPWVKSGRADGRLRLVAPEALPTGWRATSASYRSGVDPRWHLGMLTDNGKYVGVEESEERASDLVEQFVDANATQGEDVQIDGNDWQTWTDGGGDYALVLTLESPEGHPESVLVGGSAPDREIRDFAATLVIPRVR